jgi:hypothetical protein
MNIITHVFKKDVIRLKYLMLVWLLLIIVQLALGIFGQKLAAEVFELQIFLPLLMKLTGFLQGLMMIVVIPLIIQDDSVVGTTAFWYTRPILRKELLLSKSLAMLTVLILPLLAAELFVLGANGASGYHLALAVPEVIIEKLAFITPFVILAAVTPKLSRYALVGVIVFAIIVVIMILISVAGMIFPVIKQLGNSNIYKTASLEASYTVAKCFYTILIGGLLIGYQFMTRRTSRTAMLFVTACIVMWTGTLFWNFDFLKESAVVESSAIKVEGISLSFDPQNLMVSDEFRFNKSDLREKSISTKNTISGLPEGHFAILKRMYDAKMEYSDGSVLDSQYISTSKRLGYYNEEFMPSIQEVLGNMKLVNPFNEKFSYTEIFSLDEANLHKYKDKAGIYSARADLDIYKYEIVSEVPLREGIEGTFGAEQIVVYDVLERDNAVSVVLVEKKINLLFDRRVKKVSRLDMSQNIYSEYSPVYLLVNRERGEAFLPEARDNTQINAMEVFGPKRVRTKSKLLDFTDINSRNSVLPEIDNEWLAGAKLVRMNAVLTGTADVDFRVEDFVLPSESTSEASKLDELDQQLKMQEKQVQRMNPE